MIHNTYTKQDAYDTGAATVETMVDDYFFEEEEKQDA